MPIAAKARPMPSMPSFHTTMKAPKASTMPSTANISAPPNVASAGIGSRMPDRTIRIDRMVAASEKKAQRRAQMASREVGSGAMRGGAMGLFADPFQGGPVLGRNEGLGRRGRRCCRGVDRGDAVLGQRMVEQDLGAGRRPAGDAVEDRGKRPRGGLGPDRKGVR